MNAASVEDSSTVTVPRRTGMDPPSEDPAAAATEAAMGIAHVSSNSNNDINTGGGGDTTAMSKVEEIALLRRELDRLRQELTTGDDQVQQLRRENVAWKQLALEALRLDVKNEKDWIC